MKSGPGKYPYQYTGKKVTLQKNTGSDTVIKHVQHGSQKKERNCVRSQVL
jgi:hypothetical protein